MSKQTPNYGLDGGRAVRAMFVVGLAAVIGGVVIVRWTLSGDLGLAYTLKFLALAL